MQNQLHQQPYSRQPYLEQPYSEQPYSRQPYSRQPYSQQPYSRQPYSQQPYSSQPYVIHQEQQDAGIYPSYPAKSARIVGILQLILGLIILGTQIAVHVMGALGYEVFSGYWAVIFFIMAGAIGIGSSITKSRGTIVSTMVLSILSAVLSLGPIIQGILGVIVQEAGKTFCPNYFGDTAHQIYACQPDKSPSMVKLVLAFFWIMLILGFIEGIVAIVASAFCCTGCCYRSSPGVVVTNPGYTAQMTTIQNHYPYNGNQLPTTDLRGYPGMYLGGYPGSPLGYEEGPAHAAADQSTAYKKKKARQEKVRGSR